MKFFLDNVLEYHNQWITQKWVLLTIFGSLFTSMIAHQEKVQFVSAVLAGCVAFTVLILNIIKIIEKLNHMFGWDKDDDKGDDDGES